MKHCTKCKELKDESEFYKNKSAKDNLSSYCKKCQIANSVKHQPANPEYSRRWKVKNFVQTLLYKAKYRAKQKNIVFTLDVEDIIIPEVCPVLGIPLSIGNRMKNRDNSPSIDRIDNSKGYTKDNIEVISNRANRLKSDATAEELRMVANHVSKTRN